jgi:hypothetical protein
MTDAPDLSIKAKESGLLLSFRASTFRDLPELAIWATVSELYFPLSRTRGTNDLPA